MLSGWIKSKHSTSNRNLEPSSTEVQKNGFAARVYNLLSNEYAIGGGGIVHGPVAVIYYTPRDPQGVRHTDIFRCEPYFLLHEFSVCTNLVP